MKKTMALRPLLSFCRMKAAAVAIFLIVSGPSFAQLTEYKPGDKIEYKSSPNQVEWNEGTFVEKSYDGKQPVIRFKPDQYFPQGEQKCLADWNQIRPITTRSQPVQPAGLREKDGNIPTTAAGEGLLSQADIIRYLQTNLGANPFANPRSQEIKTRLAAEIKVRGLNFHFEPLSAFFNEMSQYIGVDSEISFPLKDNFGPPTKRGWLMGKWRLDKVGATTEFVSNGDLYRQEASAAANIGTLTMDAGGSYTWQATAPVATFRGSWRKATAEEMKTQGGDGIVLLGAKSGYDWVVIQNRRWTNQGDVIWVSDLATRQVREIGSRGRK